MTRAQIIDKIDKIKEDIRKNKIEEQVFKEEKGDDEAKAKRLMERVTTYRVFGDEDDKMNLNVKQVEGKVLVVSQFTLPADTKKGTRAGFSRGAHPEDAERLYNYFSDQCESVLPTERGRFAADMKVSLVNDGPVTFWLQV